MLDGAAMRVLLLTAFATMGVLLSGAAIRQADAAVPISARPSTVAAFMQKVANVCGSNGCVRVQTQRVVKHQKAGNVVPSRN
jgi:hypothetical protein